MSSDDGIHRWAVPGHPRGIWIDRGALIRAIRSEGMETYEEWWQSRRYRPCTNSRKKLANKGWGSSGMIETAAESLGLPKNGLYPKGVPPIEPLNLAANKTREAFIREIACGNILPESIDQTGAVRPTDVLEALKRLARGSYRLFNYKISDDEPFIMHVAKLLERDLWITEAEDAQGEYRLVEVSVADFLLEKNSRVQVEMLFARPVLIEARENQSLRTDLLEQFDSIIDEARGIAHRGEAFQILDPDFHCVWCEGRPGDKFILRAAIDIIARYTWRYRSLLKACFGDSGAGYISAIKRLNERRIADFVAIRDAVEQRAEPEELEDLLNDHVEPNSALIDDCHALLSKLA